jgi:hypothetical protein
VLAPSAAAAACLRVVGTVAEPTICVPYFHPGTPYTKAQLAVMVAVASTL